tara:strand:- start:761 stop:1288 length:528 start_codon:yes stop_codon:yes gene_type:complete
MEELIKAGQSHAVEKGKHIFRCGDDGTGLYVITRGITKAYYTTCDGKEFVKSFIAEGQIIACMQSLIEGKKSTFSLVTLTDSQVIHVSHAKFKQLLVNERYLPEVNNLLIGLALKKEQREYDFLCLSAKERYIKFMAANPDLATRLTQIDIAHYLGITPVALSRIRGQMDFNTTG